MYDVQCTCTQERADQADQKRATTEETDKERSRREGREGGRRRRRDRTEDKEKQDGSKSALKSTRGLSWSEKTHFCVYDFSLVVQVAV